MNNNNKSSLTPEQRREVEQFMRPQSQLVSFAKSLRMEGEGGNQATDPSKQQQQDDAQKIVDHFAGIDLDELPDNIRTAVSNAKATISQLSTSVTTAESRRAQAEQFARGKQSEADKLRGVLQHHKLTDAPPTGGNLSGDKLQERVDRLVAKGLKPEAAKVYAEMFEGELAVQEQQLMQKFAPLVGTVGNVQAQQVLGAAEAEYAHLFAVPEIAQAVRDNVAVMLQQGSTVNTQSVNHLIEMAYGKFAMNNPTKLGTLTAVPKLGGGGGMGSGGGHRSDVGAPVDGKPIARQPETSVIINAINAQMTKDLPSSKSKK